MPSARTARSPPATADRQGDAGAAADAADLRRSASAAPSTRWPTGSASASPRISTRARSRPPTRPSDGAAHEDNYTMHLPFLALHDEGGCRPGCGSTSCTGRDAGAADARERLRNTFPFFGDDMVRTGGIGEFIAGGDRRAGVRRGRQAGRAGRLARRGALAEPRPTSSRRSRTTRRRTRRSPITNLRWVVAHVPFITEDWVNRLKAIGGGLSLTSWRYLAGTPRAERAAVPDDRRQRHPRRHELRRHADRADEPVAAHVLRHHRPERARRPHQRRPADHARRRC